MRLLTLLACQAVLALAAQPASGQDAARFFEDNCASCHEIGGPPTDAPDLKDVTSRRDRAWLVRFILRPEETAEHDPVARQLLKKYDDIMPDTQDATPETIEALLDYIDGRSGAPAQPPAAAAPPPVRSATPADIALGRDLYLGRRALSGRAPSCVSCHRLESVGGFGGGTLGPDLTAVHQRLGGTQRVAAWLAKPPMPVMRAMFRDRPLAADETFAMAALFAEASTQQPVARRSATATFVGAGAGGALLALLAMGVVWSGRLRAVRRPLVDVRRHVPGEKR
jgi:mono/diheme cytochrome c family protein